MVLSSTSSLNWVIILLAASMVLWAGLSSLYPPMITARRLCPSISDPEVVLLHFIGPILFSITSIEVRRNSTRIVTDPRSPWNCSRRAFPSKWCVECEFRANAWPRTVLPCPGSGSRRSTPPSRSSSRRRNPERSGPSLRGVMQHKQVLGKLELPPRSSHTLVVVVGLHNGPPFPTRGLVGLFKERAVATPPRAPFGLSQNGYGLCLSLSRALSFTHYFLARSRGRLLLLLLSLCLSIARSRICRFSSWSAKSRQGTNEQRAIEKVSCCLE